MQNIALPGNRVINCNSETRVIGTTTYPIGCSWEAATGELAAMTYPGGHAISYSRGAAGLVVSINMNGAPLVSIVSHLPFGPFRRVPPRVRSACPETRKI